MAAAHGITCQTAVIAAPVGVACGTGGAAYGQRTCYPQARSTHPAGARPTDAIHPNSKPDQLNTCGSAKACISPVRQLTP